MRSLGLFALLLLAACSGSSPSPLTDGGDPGPAPDTAITAGPSGLTSQSAVAFEFTSTIADSRFLCTVDQNATQPCVSPLHLTLADGAHHFAVAAKSPGGAIDASPATADWTIDTTALDTVIDSGPTGATQNTSASFSFHATKAGATFQCQLDSGGWSACTSPASYDSLAEGAHTFAVAATDTIGNVDGSPATSAWTIDTTPPDTVLDSGPGGVGPTASFTFHSNESGATFQCALDGAPASSCSSGVSYSGLAGGSHSFAVFAVDAAGNADASPASTSWSVSSTFTRIRIMAANLSSGNKQSYDDNTDDTCYATPTDYGTGEGVRIFQGLQPDVVMIQEFHYFGCDGADNDADLRHFVDLAFGADYSYYREPVGGPINLPNGIISRYPIIASGQFADNSGSTQLNRSYVWARIDIPGTHDLWVVSLHLKASSGSTNAARRDTEAQQIDSDVQSLNIPAGDYLAIGGDFNTYSRSEPCLTTFQQIVDDADDLNTSASPPLYSVDQTDDGDTNASRSSPYDWVLANSSLKAVMTPVTFPSGNSFAHGLVFDSRVYTPLSDVSPVLATDSGATNMQHMGVVRDFLIPN